jgi:hypothetical protein
MTLERVLVNTRGAGLDGAKRRKGSTFQLFWQKLKLM